MRTTPLVDSNSRSREVLGVPPASRGVGDDSEKESFSWGPGDPVLGTPTGRRSRATEAELLSLLDRAALLPDASKAPLYALAEAAKRFTC